MSNAAPAWAVICHPEKYVTLGVASFCGPTERQQVSPLDDLIAYYRLVMPLGDKEKLSKNRVLGRVLLLGLVSGAEMYFRSMIVRVIQACPIAREIAADQLLSLAAVDYYGREAAEFGLLEGISFASEGELLKSTRRFTGIDWDPKSTSVGVAVGQFEGLAHFRHAAVHARGELGPRNIRALGVDSNTRKSLTVEFAELQHAAEICMNAARAYNRHIFQRIIERWIGAKRLSGNWKIDRGGFGKAVNLCSSREDMMHGPSYTRHLYQKLLPVVQSSLRSRSRV